MAVRYKVNIFRFFKRNFSEVPHVSPKFDTVDNIIARRPTGTVKNIKGWVRSLRKMKDSIFIDVTDGTCCDEIQVVCPKSKRPEGLEYGASVDITGEVQLALNGQQLEIAAKNIKVIGTCGAAGKSKGSDVYPITPKQKHSLDYLRSFLHLRLQTKFFQSLVRIRSGTTFKVHDFFNLNQYIQVHTPILTANDCEGAGEIFKVQPADEKLLVQMKKEEVPLEKAFFDDNAYLTVSGQLHLEAVARRFHRVYTFNPTFRAENSKSRLHLSEFYMIEVEEAFVDSMQEILYIIENFVKTLLCQTCYENEEDVVNILNYNETDLVQHLKMIDTIITKPFGVMTFSEALNVLDKKCKLTVTNDGLTKEQELALVKYHDNVPVFVIDWPKKIKPFYMKETDSDPNLVSAVDLLVPNVGELCGGGLREDNYEKLKLKLKEAKLSKSLNWYLDLRKFGSVPTAGFGMGFERFLQFMLNIQNIKDTIPFPRSPHSLQL